MPKDQKKSGGTGPQARSRKKGQAGRNKAASRRWRAIFKAEFNSKPLLYAALITARSARALLQDQIATVASLHPNLTLPVPREECGAWALGIAGTIGVPPIIERALNARRVERTEARWSLRQLARNVFIPSYLTTYVTARNALVKLEFNPLPPHEEYPPRGHWVASTPGIYKTWKQYLANCPLPDKGMKRKPVHLLERGRLSYSIPAELSCLIYDKKTKELVMVVIRDFCGVPAILKLAMEIVSRAAAVRRSVRKEDSGTLMLAGYSCGSRSAPSFGITRNFESGEGHKAEREDNIAISQILAYFWARAKGRYPDEVTEDIENFYDKYNIPRFDPDWPASATRSADLSLKFGGREFTFKDVERAPGCAILCQRYARPVHCETQGHEFAIAWTHHRQGLCVDGGHFYYSEYGLEMQNAEDTSFGWRPKKKHTTGLQNYEPTFEVPALGEALHNQQAIAFVSASRLKSVYLKWESVEGISGQERAQKALDDLDQSESFDEIYA